MQALIPLLRQTVVAQEYAAIAAKHTAAADKELALRSRANALAPLVVRWTGRQMSNRAPRPESYYISDQYRDEELARLQSVWPPLF